MAGRFGGSDNVYIRTEGLSGHGRRDIVGVCQRRAAFFVRSHKSGTKGQGSGGMGAKINRIRRCQDGRRMNGGSKRREFRSYQPKKGRGLGGVS